MDLEITVVVYANDAEVQELGDKRLVVERKVKAGNYTILDTRTYNDKLEP